MVTVITALPAAFAVTFPLELTEATELLLDVQETALLVAFEGDTVAVSVSLSFSYMVSELLFSVTPVTDTGDTVTLHVAFFPPSEVVAVITALPTALAVT